MKKIALRLILFLSMLSSISAKDSLHTQATSMDTIKSTPIKDLNNIEKTRVLLSLVDKYLDEDLDQAKLSAELALYYAELANQSDDNEDTRNLKAQAIKAVSKINDKIQKDRSFSALDLISSKEIIALAALGAGATVYLYGSGFLSNAGSAALKFASKNALVIGVVSLDVLLAYLCLTCKDDQNMIDNFLSHKKTLFFLTLSGLGANWYYGGPGGDWIGWGASTLSNHAKKVVFSMCIGATFNFLIDFTMEEIFEIDKKELLGLLK